MYNTEYLRINTFLLIVECFFAYVLYLPRKFRCCCCCFTECDFDYLHSLMQETRRISQRVNAICAQVLGKKEILRAITNQTDDTVFQSQYSETQINFV